MGEQRIEVRSRHSANSEQPDEVITKFQLSPLSSQAKYCSLYDDVAMSLVADHHHRRTSFKRELKGNDLRAARLRTEFT